MHDFKNKTLELAKVTLKAKDLKRYRDNHAAFCAAVNGLTGNKVIKTWQNIAKPTEIVDIGLWSDLKSAKSAAEKVETSSEFARFFEPMQSVDFFDHFEFIDELALSIPDEDTFLEVYLYNIDPNNAKTHLADKLTFAKMITKKSSGFVRYSWFKSIEKPELQLDLFWYKRTENEEIENEAIEAEISSGKFMQSITEFLGYDTYVPFVEQVSKVDLTKTNKTYYNAKLSPELVELDWYNYISVTGKGAPESKAFEQAMSNIYPVAYKTKFRSKELGKDYVVPKMEGFWFVENGEFEDAKREDWCWTVMIPLPSFVHPKMVKQIITELGFEESVKVELQKTAKHAQMLHMGSYEAEEETLKVLHSFIADSNLKMAGYHREVYIKN